MKIYVTGGDGTIGNLLCSGLKSAGYDSKSVSYKAFNYEEFKGQPDSAFDLALRVLFEEESVIVHCAWKEFSREQHSTVSIEDHFDIRFAKSLSRVANDISARIVFVSSDYVYSGGINVYKDSEEARPSTLYGMLKKEVENIFLGKNNASVLRISHPIVKGSKFLNFAEKTIRAGDSAFDNTVKLTPVSSKTLIGGLVNLIEYWEVGRFNLTDGYVTCRHQIAEMMLNHIVTVNHVIPESRQGIFHNSIMELSPRFNALKKTPLNESINQYFITEPTFSILNADQRGMLANVLRNKSVFEVNFANTLKNTIRGKHYHEFTVELFSITSGKVIVTLNDLAKRETTKFYASAGDVFEIKTNIEHIIETIEDSSWLSVNYYDDKYLDIKRTEK